MAGEFGDGRLPGLELAFKRVGLPHFISQGNGYDCVPATLVNTAQLMGFELVNTQGRNLDLGLLRRVLGWPPAPEYVDVHSISNVLNKLPSIVEGKSNATLSPVRIFGGASARYVHIIEQRTLSPEDFSAHLYGYVKEGQGVVLGFRDHASVWAPVKITTDDVQLIHVDSRLNPPQAPIINWQKFNQYVRQNSLYASPDGEHPVLFELTTARILQLRRLANNVR